MNISFHINTSWELTKDRIKESNTHLTDEDLQFSPGKEEEMYKRIAVKLNKTTEEVKNWIESLAANKSMAG